MWKVLKRRPMAAAGLGALLLLASTAEGTGISFIVPVLEILNNGGSAVPDSQVSRFIASGFGRVNIPYAMWTVVLFGFVLFATHAIMKYFRMTVSARISEVIASDMRVQLFDNLVNMDLEFIHKRRGSEFTNSLITETSRVQVSFLQAIDLIALLLESCLYLAVAIILSWQLVSGALVMIFCVIVILKFELKRASEYGRRLTDTNNALQHTAIEHLGGLRIIKAFNLERRSVDTFSAQSQQIPDIRFQATKSRARLSTFYETGMVAGLLGVVLYAVTIANMSTAVLLTFIFVLYRLYPKIGAMNKAIHQLMFSAPGVENVIALTEQTSAPKIKSGPRKLESFANEIRFENVSFAYDPGHDVVRGIDLSIKAGETTALVGGSGAGKSTIVSLVMRFYDPTSGRITVDGEDLRNLDLVSWKNAIALVNQDTFLFNDTIAANIAMGRPGATMDEIVRAAKRAYAHDFIQELPEGYDTLVGDRGVRLSGGQRQRMSLARAVIREPLILILDEATSELDSVSEDLIRQAVVELGAERTVLTIAHRLSTIRHADKIIVLEHGSVAEEGTHDSLLHDGRQYAEYMRLQNFVTTHGD
jgi:subfamily B ATP-binding cassette protein MsbA